MTVKPQGNYHDTNSLGKVSILGVARAPSSISLNGNALGSSGWTYSGESQLLILKDMKEHFPEGAWTSQWNLAWA